ncbi:IS701 family transposase [Streptomyces longwoodensis]
MNSTTSCCGSSRRSPHPRRHRLRQERHHLRRCPVQDSGNAGRTENCQIGVVAAYATTRGRALVDREPYLPTSWTDDRERCRAAKIPDERGFATRPELAGAMVLRALASPLPIAWVTADAVYGQEWRFRRMLEETAIGYVLAVPKSQPVPRFGRIDHPFGQAPDEAGEQRLCGDGAKGPRCYDWAVVQLPMIEDFDDERPTYHRWAVARRSISRPDQIACYLAYAPTGTGVGQLVRVAGRRWAIEECSQAAKNECGLDQYEVCRYVGWMRHITLAMPAHALLAATAAQAAAQGDAETVPPWSRSPWQKSADCWQLAPHTDPARPFASIRRVGRDGGEGVRPWPGTVTTGDDVIRRRGGPARPPLTCRQPTTLPTTPLNRPDSKTLLEY